MSLNLIVQFKNIPSGLIYKQKSIKNFDSKYKQKTSNSTLINISFPKVPLDKHVFISTLLNGQNDILGIAMKITHKTR
jgi:hypothetical protein